MVEDPFKVPKNERASERALGSDRIQPPTFPLFRLILECVNLPPKHDGSPRLNCPRYGNLDRLSDLYATILVVHLSQCFDSSRRTCFLFDF